PAPGPREGADQLVAVGPGEPRRQQDAGSRGDEEGARPEEPQPRRPAREQSVGIEEADPPAEQALPGPGCWRGRPVPAGLPGEARGLRGRQEEAAGAGQLDELAEVVRGQRLAKALLERPADAPRIADAIELAEQEGLLLAEGEVGARARVLDHVAPLLAQWTQQQVQPPGGWDERWSDLRHGAGQRRAGRGSMLVRDRILTGGPHGGTGGADVGRSGSPRNPDARAQGVGAGNPRSANGHAAGARADLRYGVGGVLVQQDEAAGQFVELAEV